MTRSQRVSGARPEAELFTSFSRRGQFATNRPRGHRVPVPADQLFRGRPTCGIGIAPRSCVMIPRLMLLDRPRQEIR